MPLSTIPTLVFAAALLALLLADVFLTVFDPRGRGGPLNRVQNRSLWRLMRVLARRKPAALSLGAPLLVVLTLCVWVLLLVAAFAIAYYPFIDTFLVSPGSTRGPWVEAIYYSGYTAATLGFGDIVPDLPWLRLLAPIEAFLGFALLSVSVTYLLAVYRELLAMHTLATTLDAWHEAGLLEQLERDTIAAPTERFLEWASVAVLHGLNAHFQYPVLHYFRAEDARRALPLQFDPLVRHAARNKAEGVSKGLSYDAFFEAVERYLTLVETHFIPPDFETDVASQDATEAARAQRRLLRFMLYTEESQRTQ